MTSFTRNLIRICFARKIMSPYSSYVGITGHAIYLVLNYYTPFSLHTFDCNNSQQEAENSIVNVGRNILKMHTVNGVPLSRAHEHLSFI